MANTFTATGLQQLSSAFVAGLYDAGTLIGTVWRDAEAGFVAGKGDTVTVRAPQVVEATNFTGTATITGIGEGSLDIKLDQEPYSQVALNAKELTFDVENLAIQVVNPQVAGIAEYVDEAIATELSGTTGTASGATWREAVSAGYAALTANKVPLSNRWLGVAPDVAGSLLNDTIFVSAGDRGDNGAALNDAILGSLYGFKVFTASAFAPGTAVAYHETAVAGIWRTPTPPNGGVTVGSSSFGGVSAQILYGYDNTKLADVITARTLFGLGTGDDFDKRAILLTVATTP